MGMVGHKQSVARQMRRQQQWAFAQELSRLYREASACRALVVYEPQLPAVVAEKTLTGVNVLPPGLTPIELPEVASTPEPTREGLPRVWRYDLSGERAPYQTKVRRLPVAPSAWTPPARKYARASRGLRQEIEYKSVYGLQEFVK